MLIKKKRYISLQTKIQLLIIVVILVSLIFGEYLIGKYVTDEVEHQIGERALAIARSVSEIPEIKESLMHPSGYQRIDPITERIKDLTEAEFIVVIDMEGIRYSHPVKSRIGKKIVGGDEGPVLKGKEYTSKAVGTLGPSLRAFVPIYYDNKQVGAVVVGILITDLEKLIKQAKTNINIAIFTTLIFGFLGAIVLTNNVKKELFGMEPTEIAALFEMREAILSSIKEGVIAVNREGEITLINEQAKALLNIEGDILGESAEEVIPNTRLPEVIKTGTPELDQEQLLNNRKIITNRIPIKLNDQVVGAVASFRDMTEMKRLAEELTGVREYAEALRAQSHEFKNKLHTISGLVQLEKYDKVVDFITNTQTKHKTNVDILTNQIKDPYVGGVIFGKMALAAEKGIKIIVDKESILPKLPEALSRALVLILGNLLQNALEAVSASYVRHKLINILIIYNVEYITISIRDQGPGIPEDVKEKIFHKGFTTKGENNKGLGLTLIQEQLHLLKGTIEVRTGENRGTEFIVTIPHNNEEA